MRVIGCLSPERGERIKPGAEAPGDAARKNPSPGGATHDSWSRLGSPLRGFDLSFWSSPGASAPGFMRSPLPGLRTIHQTHPRRRTGEIARSLATSATASRSRRRGLTLFEVLIALVIFVTSMAAIGQLVSNGVRAALQARFQTQAAMMCEAKLAEVVAGIVPLTAGQAVYPDDPNWSWTLALSAAPVPHLLRAEVTVKREGTNSKGKASFTMARYVRDPQMYLAAQEEAQRLEQEKAEAAE